MPKRVRRRKKFAPPPGSTREKGDLVEGIVALMHEMPGVTVDRNIYLPTIDGSGRVREIDVLLTSNVAGHPVRVAIECKNDAKPIGIESIDEFISRLADVGLPSQNGIFISASHYRSGATKRARAAGVRTLILKNLSEGTLSSTISAAFLSHIYLLLTITRIEVINDIVRSEDSIQMLIFRDQDGQICGSIPDLVWHLWVQGEISQDLGVFEQELEIPSDWRQVVDGLDARVKNVKVELQVSGHVATYPGKVREYQLVDSESETVERHTTQADFRDRPKKVQIASFLDDNELRKYLRELSAITLTIGKVRLPRLRFGPMYWPPSLETAQKIISVMQDFFDGKIPDPRPLDFSVIEGDDLVRVFDPIMNALPVQRGRGFQKPDETGQIETDEDAG